MGLQNFAEQKAKLDGIQNDLSDMRSYVNQISSLVNEMHHCWNGNKDKQRFVAAIEKHLHSVNQMSSEFNTFMQTATFVLLKINELGKLTGMNRPSIAPSYTPGVTLDCSQNTKIKIDTNQLREIALKIEKQGRYLDDVAVSINKTKNVIDAVILTIFGLGASLLMLDNQISILKEEHRRIVNALKRICDIYEATEAELQRRMRESLIFGGGHSSVLTAVPHLVFLNYKTGGSVSHDFADTGILTVSELFDNVLNKTLNVLGILDEDYETEFIKKGLYDLLSKMNQQTDSLQVPDQVQAAIKTFKETGEWNEAFYKANKELIDGMGDISKLLDYGEKGVDAAAYLFTDYSSNIETLQALKDTNLNDPIMNAAIDEMIVEYRDKFRGSANNVADYIIEKGADALIELIPGIKAVSTATDVISGITGMGDYADTLRTNAAATIYSRLIEGAFEQAMTKLESGNYTSADVTQAEKLFDLTRAALLQQYESGFEIANTDEQRLTISQGISELNNLSFSDVFNKNN